MTPKSFFTIILKLIGLYVIISNLASIPQYVSTFLMFQSEGYSNFALILIALLVICVLYEIYYLTIVKTDWVIEKLSLDKHFSEEKFDLNIHRSTIMNIALIIIGGLLFVESLPILLSQVFTYIRETEAPREQSYTGFWVLVYLAKPVLGFFLVTNSQTVTNFIEKQRKQK